AGPPPTPTATPPPTATPTPCPDYDGDTICSAADPDDDNDGCTDTAEQQSSPGSETSGGRRNPQYFWDFYDVWTQSANPPFWLRTKTIDLFDDIFGVAVRYGTQNAVPGTETQRIFAALTPPTSATGYHIDYDRSAPMGMDAWDMGPPDGTIDLFSDIFGVAFQFGHDCN
ncbi:MAG: flexitail domain-containing putative surface protein, partial [Dehalococcoidia bacterium]